MRTDHRRAAAPNQVGRVIPNQPICRGTRTPSASVTPEKSGRVRDNPPYLVTTGAARLSRGCAMLLFSAASDLHGFRRAADALAITRRRQPTTPGLPSYDSFRLVHNAQRLRSRPPPGASARLDGLRCTATTRADYVALTGIAVDGDKSLAFFLRFAAGV